MLYIKISGRLATVLVNLALDSFKYMCVCVCVCAHACVSQGIQNTVLINYKGVKQSGDKPYVGKGE